LHWRTNTNSFDQKKVGLMENNIGLRKTNIISFSLDDRQQQHQQQQQQQQQQQLLDCLRGFL
jgi:hypothetical protein